MNQNEPERVVSEKRELLTYMGHEYETLFFVMLSEPNGTPLGKQYLDYCKFFWKLACKTKTHIHWRAGVETGDNSHGHFIVSVPTSQSNYFKGRLHRFKPSKEWKFRKLGFDEWKTGHNTEWYVTVKHKDLGARVECPGVGPCRHSDCKYKQEHSHQK